MSLCWYWPGQYLPLDDRLLGRGRSSPAQWQVDLDSVKRQVLALTDENTDNILIEVYPDPDATRPSPVTGICFDSDIDDWVATA